VTTPRAPLQFSTVVCQNCGAIIALIPPGALIVTTKLRCVQCHVDRTLAPVKGLSRIGEGVEHTTV
jgi:hypothetical protein